jgi:hypothetical protein
MLERAAEVRVRGRQGGALAVSRLLSAKAASTAAPCSLGSARALETHQSGRGAR